MLTRTDICLSFPVGAVFHTSPSLTFYKNVLRLIHRISCMNSAGKCFECPMKKNCRYAWITGNSFHDYPGLLCSVDQFEQRRYKPGERLTASLYWIGDCESFKSIAELAVSNMNQRLNGCFFIFSLFGIA